jgi:hypothetical protein
MPIATKRAGRPKGSRRITKQQRPHLVQAYPPLRCGALRRYRIPKQRARSHVMPHNARSSCLSICRSSAFYSTRRVGCSTTAACCCCSRCYAAGGQIGHILGVPLKQR